MKQKWKCSICNKVLSSKQIVENHIIKLHPDSDKSVKQYIQVQVTSEEKQSKKPKKVKAKAAYASFSGLFNIFANKDLCKDFSLYPQANQKDKNKQQQPPINQTADMQGVIEARNDSTIGSGELVLTEAIGVTMPKDDSTMGPHESGDDNVMVGDITNRNDSEAENLVNNSDAGNNDNDGFLPQLTQFLSESLSHPLPPIDLDISTSNLFNNLEEESEISPFLAGTSSIQSAPRVPMFNNFGQTAPASVTQSNDRRKEFKAPFKTRGKCGCEGCVREPCRICYFCQHKEAK